MFLAKVKVKRFAESRKKWGRPPFLYNCNINFNYRVVETLENKKSDEIFTVIGVTKLLEGYSDYLGYDEGYAFRQNASKKVYIVAQGLGRRYKVLPEDLEVLE